MVLKSGGKSTLLVTVQVSFKFLFWHVGPAGLRQRAYSNRMNVDVAIFFQQQIQVQ